MLALTLYPQRGHTSTPLIAIFSILSDYWLVEFYPPGLDGDPWGDPGSISVKGMVARSPPPPHQAGLVVTV